jgi:protein-disulfide isomerase
MRIRSLFLATLVTVGMSTTVYAADTLTPAQQKQVQQIVHDYLLNNPQILVQVSQKLQEQQMQQMQQVQQNAQKVIPDVSAQLFNDKTSPVSGNLNGDVTMVEFFDYQCPHCKDMATVIESLAKQDGNLKIIYKELPIFGADSQFAAAAALASVNQGKYEQFHNALMQAPDPLTNDVVMQVAQSAGLNVDQLKKDMNSDAIKQELKDNVQLAQKLQLMGTPAFVITNTKNIDQSVLIPGTTSQDVLQSIISQARTNKLANNS